MLEKVERQAGKRHMTSSELVARSILTGNSISSALRLFVLSPIPALVESSSFRICRCMQPLKWQTPVHIMTRTRVFYAIDAAGVARALRARYDVVPILCWRIWLAGSRIA
jgi:hypothetical protein